jgi:hypothetical protein
MSKKIVTIIAAARESRATRDSDQLSFGFSSSLVIAHLCSPRQREREREIPEIHRKAHVKVYSVEGRTDDVEHLPVFYDVIWHLPDITNAARRRTGQQYRCDGDGLQKCSDVTQREHEDDVSDEHQKRTRKRRRTAEAAYDVQPSKFADETLQTKTAEWRKNKILCW